MQAKQALHIWCDTTKIDNVSGVSIAYLVQHKISYYVPRTIIKVIMFMHIKGNTPSVSTKTFFCMGLPFHAPGSL